MRPYASSSSHTQKESAQLPVPATAGWALQFSSALRPATRPTAFTTTTSIVDAAMPARAGEAISTDRSAAAGAA